ncbi:MAG: type IV pilus assembly protein PilM [Planctomycetales bacterium]|nr:type IV pilus assembly protein PilM [Planctomycetales bacterium]
MTAAWGLDIGRRAVKACALRKVRDTVELSTVDVVEMDAPADALTDQAIQEFQRRAVATLIQRHGLHEPTAVAIPGHVTFSKVIRVQAADPDRLARNMRFEAQHNIPFPISEVVWDYHPLTVGTPEIEVNLYAAKKEQVLRLLAWLEDAGLDVASVQIAPLALWNYVRFDLDLRGGHLLLDIGSDNTDLIVADGDRTWIRNMPIAGNAVTKALMQQFQVSFAEAEALKIKAGTSQDAQKIFNVMKPVLKDLMSEVDRSLAYYKSSVPNAEFQKVILLGNAMKLVGLRSFVEETLKAKTVKLVNLNRLQYGTALDMEAVRNQLPGLGVALGLALQGVGMAGTPVNLLPEESRAERVLRRKRPWYAAAAAVLLAASAGLAYEAQSSSKAFDGSKGRLEAGVADYAKVADELKRASDLAPLRREIGALADLGLGREAVLDLWGALLAMAPAANADPNEKNEGRKAWILSLDLGWPDGSPAARGARVPANGGAARPRGIVWRLAGAVVWRENEGETRAFIEQTVVPRIVAHPSGLGKRAKLGPGVGVAKLSPGAEPVKAGEKARFYRFQVEGEVSETDLRAFVQARTAPPLAGSSAVPVPPVTASVPRKKG